MNLGAPELLIGLAAVAAVALPIWGIADAALRPSDAWRSIGQNRTVWIALQLVLTFVFGIGLIVALVYLLAIRPKLAAAGRR